MEEKLYNIVNNKDYTNYKFNEEKYIFEMTKNGGGSSGYVRDLVTLVDSLSRNDIRYIIVNENDIQIER